MSMHFFKIYCVVPQLHFYELSLQLVKLGVKCNLGLSKHSQKRSSNLISTNFETNFFFMLRKEEEIMQRYATREVRSIKCNLGL